MGHQPPTTDTMARSCSQTSPGHTYIHTPFLSAIPIRIIASCHPRWKSHFLFPSMPVSLLNSHSYPYTYTIVLFLSLSLFLPSFLSCLFSSHPRLISLYPRHTTQALHHGGPHFTSQAFFLLFYDSTLTSIKVASKFQFVTSPYLSHYPSPPPPNFSSFFVSLLLFTISSSSSSSSPSSLVPFTPHSLPFLSAYLHACIWIVVMAGFSGFDVWLFLPLFLFVLWYHLA